MSAKTYLGETPVKLEDSPFAGYGNSEWAMYFIDHYGQIDGAHHKTWVLDQVARCLHGGVPEIRMATWSDHSPEYRVSDVPKTESYEKWVKSMLGDFLEEYDSYEYDYDEGISP